MDCILCESQKKDWKEVCKIVKGFPISRTADDLLALYEQLMEAGNGEIIRKPCDFSERKGLTNKPLSTSSQHTITVTHSYINVLGWFLKLIYRCHDPYESWVEKRTIIGEPIRRAKERIQNIIQQKLGLRLDQVSTANDKGGTSNDGNQACRFLVLNQLMSLQITFVISTKT